MFLAVKEYMPKTSEKRFSMKHPFRPVPEKVDEITARKRHGIRTVRQRTCKENPSVPIIADPIVRAEQVHLYYGKTEALKISPWIFPGMR